MFGFHITVCRGIVCDFQSLGDIRPIAADVKLHAGLLGIDRLIVQPHEFVEVGHGTAVHRTDHVIGLQFSFRSGVTGVQRFDRHTVAVIQLIAVGIGAGDFTHAHAPDFQFFLLADDALQAQGFGLDVQAFAPRRSLREIGSWLARH